MIPRNLGISAKNTDCRSLLRWLCYDGR